MNIHEYQAKEILRKFGVKTLKGGVANDSKKAIEVANSLGGDIWVVKAQIHAGGRGKGGGVQVVKSEAELKEEASKII